MATKYEKLTKDVHNAILARDAADIQLSVAQNAMRDTSAANHGQLIKALNSVDAARSEYEAAVASERRAVAAVKRHCAYIRAELAAMQEM